VFVCTLFSGSDLPIRRGAPVPEKLIFPVFSMLFWVVDAMCAAGDLTVSTLTQVFLRHNPTPSFSTLYQRFDLPIVTSWRPTKTVTGCSWKAAA
jgi:hypothetical protein